MRTFRILLAGWLLGAVAIVLLSLGDVVARPADPAAAPVAVAPVSVRPGLLVPVQGIGREELKDTFLQLRGGGRTHHALDILAPRGTPVVAAVDGKVEKLFNSKAGGLTVYQFDVAEEKVYYYAHLDRYADGLKEGQFVTQGTVIGYVGTSGNAPPDAPHLHFAIEVLTPEKRWWKGTPINPFPLLTAAR